MTGTFVVLLASLISQEEIPKPAWEHQSQELKLCSVGEGGAWAGLEPG